MGRRLPRDLPTEVLIGYPARKGKITVKILKSTNYENVYILFEGTAAALEFAGRLFLAQAHYKGDCYYHIAPNGRGGRIFTDDSTLGIYIHRLPCMETKGYRRANESGGNTKILIKKLLAMARDGWSTKASNEARRMAGVEFASLYRRAMKAWPTTIRISDGRRTYADDGTIGYYFPTLSASYSASEDRTAGSPYIVGLMLWTIFGGLHTEATRRFEQGSKRQLRVSELDRKTLARALVRNLNAIGWKREREEFLRANPEARVASRAAQRRRSR